MNLVQIAEDLKGLPLQALQGYMNGANPSVPPYLAAAEMQRRQSAMQKQQLAQGAAQGKAPSVKEQLDQAATNMTAQAVRQQQGIQQLMQQAGRGVAEVPERTPQPEAQPEPPEMASGGIVNIPVRGSMFRDGGIVGFAGGGTPQYLSDEEREAELRRMLGSHPSPEPVVQSPAATGEAPAAAPAVDPMTAKALYPEVLKALRKDIEATTPEKVMEQQRALERGAGLPELEARRKRMEADYAASKEGRGMEDIIRTLSGKGVGLGALAQGYLSAQDANRAADAKFAQQMAEMHGNEVYAKHGAYSKAYDTASTTEARQREMQNREMADLYKTMRSAEGQERYTQAMIDQAAIKASGGLGDAKLDASVLNSEIKALTDQIKQIQLNPQQNYSAEGRARIAELQAQVNEKMRLLEEVRLRTPGTPGAASAGTVPAAATSASGAKPAGGAPVAYTMSTLRAAADEQVAKTGSRRLSDAELLELARQRRITVVPG